MSVKLVRWEGMGARWPAISVGNEETERDVVFQTAILRAAWTWGFVCIWYDGPWMSFGLGPLLLAAWRPWTRRGYRFARWLYECEWFDSSG